MATKLQTGDIFLIKGIPAFPMLKLDRGYFDIRNEVVGEDKAVEAIGYEVMEMKDILKHGAFVNYTREMVEELVKDRLKQYNK